MILLETRSGTPMVPDLEKLKPDFHPICTSPVVKLPNQLITLSRYHVCERQRTTQCATFVVAAHKLVCCLYGLVAQT